MEEKKVIKSFRDLLVYQSSYEGMLIIMKKVIPLLPQNEKFDLVDQISRSCKAIPRLIAEGYAKRHQKTGFQKYIDDSMAECNETIVSLEQCKDLYDVDEVLISSLITFYDRVGRQLYRLSQAWTSFKRQTP